MNEQLLQSMMIQYFSNKMFDEENTYFFVTDIDYHLNPDDSFYLLTICYMGNRSVYVPTERTIRRIYSTLRLYFGLPITRVRLSFKWVYSLDLLRNRISI